MNFDKYLFRASQCYDLTTGSIGLTNEQKKEMNELINERDTGININGNKVKWTDAKKKKLDKYIYEHENPSLPKTMQSSLRDIHRQVKYGRKFMFTNKYVQKGINQEEESFSLYQEWLEKVKGVKTLLLNNKERLNNEFFTGETDSNQHFLDTFGYGFDIKTSWSFDTFPFEEDDLDIKYQWQNLVYMDLTGAKKWKTVYVLVNTSEDLLHKEKQKWFYALNCHTSEKNEEKYVETCRELEKLHIVDYDRFVHINPYHELTISRSEWMSLNLDIPLKDRIIEKTIEFNQSRIDFLKNRVIIARKYLNSL